MRTCLLIYAFVFLIAACVDQEAEKSNIKKPKIPPNTPEEQILGPSGPTTEYITIPQGLPGYNKIASNYVNCIHFDSQGKLYLCTDGGLSISNDAGATFTTKTTSNGLITNQVMDIVTDSNGVIYAAIFENGIVYSTDNGETFTPITGLPSSTVNTLFEKDGKIYAGCYGLTIISNLGETITNYQTNNSNLPNNSIQSIYVDSNDIIYVATSSGLSISVDNGASYTTIGVAEGITNLNLKAVFVSSSGKVIIGSNDHLFISQDNYATRDSNNQLALDSNGFTKQNVANNTVKSVLEDSNGIIFAVTNFGFTKLTNNNGTISTSNKLIGPSLFDVALDSSGNIYVTSDLGLYISTDQGANYNLTSTSTGIARSIIKDIEFDSQNNLYVATDYGGLAISNDEGSTFTVKTNMASKRVYGIAIDQTNDKIFLATYSGISISDDYGETFTNKTTADGLANNTVFCIVYKNGVLYAGLNNTTNSFAYSTDGGITFTSRSSNGYKISKLYVDDAGKIYAIADGGGGILIAQDYNSPFTTLQGNGLSSNFNYSIAGGPDQKIYIGGFGVINIMTDNGELASPRYTFEYINSSSGLVALGYLYHFYFGANDELYVSTKIGLSISNDGGSSFVTKTGIDGLANKNISIVKKDSQGKIYIGTYSGLSVLNDL